MNQQKGFTLVEVLVVIVILGILAAVAVPKLFGNVAKAKASEIPAAASSYINAQNAYLGANAYLGNWSNIGYEAPGNGSTENFCYSQGNLLDTVSVGNLQGGAIGWGATNKVALDNCHVNSWWSIVITPKGGNSVDYVQNVSGDVCAPLVYNWQVGTTMNGACESANAPAIESTTPSVESTPAGDNSGNSGSIDSKPKEENKTTASEDTQKKQQATQSAVQAAKEAFNKCTGNTCTKAEKDRLKAVWDEEKEKCKQLYGNAVCND